MIKIKVLYYADNIALYQVLFRLLFVGYRQALYQIENMLGKSGLEKVNSIPESIWLTLSNFWAGWSEWTRGFVSSSIRDQPIN